MNDASPVSKVMWGQMI